MIHDLETYLFYSLFKFYLTSGLQANLMVRYLFGCRNLIHCMVQHGIASLEQALVHMLRIPLEVSCTFLLITFTFFSLRLLSSL